MATSCILKPHTLAVDDATVAGFAGWIWMDEDAARRRAALTSKKSGSTVGSTTSRDQPSRLRGELEAITSTCIPWAAVLQNDDRWSPAHPIHSTNQLWNAIPLFNVVIKGLRVVDTQIDNWRFGYITVQLPFNEIVCQRGSSVVEWFFPFHLVVRTFSDCLVVPLSRLFWCWQ